MENACNDHVTCSKYLYQNRVTISPRSFNTTLHNNPTDVMCETQDPVQTGSVLYQSTAVQICSNTLFHRVDRRGRGFSST